jgi:hypothetical protein
MNDTLCLLIVIGTVILTGVAGAGTSNAVQIYMIIAGIVVALGYLVPTVIARNRRHPNARSITALNVMLGWTLIGWIAALAWALLGKPSATRVIPHNERLKA